MVSKLSYLSTEDGGKSLLRFLLRTIILAILNEGLIEFSEVGNVLKIPWVLDVSVGGGDRQVARSLFATYFL